MPGTILVTGANGSIAVQAVQHLLSNAPESITLILTVRNPSDDTDPHTKRLRETASRFVNSGSGSSVVFSIRRLDLASLKDVRDFASTIAGEVARGEIPPLSAIVCNAFHWNLRIGEGEVEVTEDGMEKTMQVNLVAHAALVLRLLGSFQRRDGENTTPVPGRIVLFTSDAHCPGRNGLEVYPPRVPADLEDLVRKGGAMDDGDGNDGEEKEDGRGRGFWRYANSKLAILMWTYALNRYLEKDESLSHVSAVAIDPGSITDSRALRTNTPAILSHIQKFVLQPLGPVLQFLASGMRSSSDAGVDVADLVLGRRFAGERGYLNLVVPGPSSEESLDERKQRDIWLKTAEWAGISREDTVLEGGF